MYTIQECAQCCRAQRCPSARAVTIISDCRTHITLSVRAGTRARACLPRAHNLAFFHRRTRSRPHRHTFVHAPAYASPAPRPENTIRYYIHMVSRAVVRFLPFARSRPAAADVARCGLANFQIILIVNNITRSANTLSHTHTRTCTCTRTRSSHVSVYNILF